MIFVYILFLSAFMLATAAGYFSVAGLAITYGGSFLAVVALGCTIEVGKLTAISFLYRFWTHIGYMLRMTLILMISCVMIVTSFGVFGYLTKANQTDMIGLKQSMASIDLLEEEGTQLKARKIQIDQQIAQLSPEDVKGRIRLNQQFRTEIDNINKRLPEIARDKAIQSANKIQQQADIGPLVFIAKALGYDVDIATTWFTLLLVAVFDPLAIILTFCANIALVQYKQKHLIAEVVAEQPLEVAVTPVRTTKISYEHLLLPSLTFATPIVEPIWEDRVHKPTEVEAILVEAEVDELQGKIDNKSDDQDWNHFVNKRLHSSSQKELADKIIQLNKYATDLNSRDPNTLTEDEIILRSRILNFIERHERTTTEIQK